MKGILLVLLVWSLTACALAQEAAIQDGAERAAWEIRPDPGAHYVKASQDKNIGIFGEQSMRLDFTVAPQNEWWSVVKCAIGKNPDPEKYNGLRVACRTSILLPAGAITASANRIQRSPELNKVGDWQYIDIILPEPEVSGVRFEVILKHTMPGIPEKFTLHVDGPAWAHVAEISTEITQLKKMCIDTALIEAGKPKAVIVAPPDNRYAEAIEVVQKMAQKLTGVKLPVLRDEIQTSNPKEILKTQNVIALGNMATNPFTEEMYRKWYVLLDLRYPGEKGYVVRSLHNPYGTDHNVIWLGGSDDEGVLSAARVFADILKTEERNSLKVGWLMEIKLGEGMTPPKLDLDAKQFDVYSWRDSFRTRGEKKTGYAPSTYFGWNPISIAGVLYYMTGDKEYLDAFKAMAMPDPENPPRPNVSDESFNNPINPLVENYHYRAHLVDCVYDLIEESPLFDDEERLFLTNKLLEHQNDFDPGDSFCRPSGSRHDTWHMICIYTGSRYFDKYYPQPRWKKRMQNSRRAFEGVLENAERGEGDLFCWVDTAIEPIFEFFMLDGFDKFVESGTAREKMDSLEALWTNTSFEESVECRAISLLHKAAYMLNDGRYIWMRDKLGFDMSQFRIGQSFFPPPDLPVNAPDDLANRISIFPLSKQRWTETGEAIPLEEAFQLLAYRTGLDSSADIFQIDGFYGKSRTSYHVNALYTLYMFGGKRLLYRGYNNQLTIRANGMVEPVVPRAAAIKRAVTLGDVAYVHTNVPNMAFSAWDRHLIYIPDNYAIVVDEVTSRETGVFDVTVKWTPRGATPAPDEKNPRKAVCKNGTVIQCSEPIDVACAPRSVVQNYNGQLIKDETRRFSNILYWSDAENERNFTIDPVAPGANVIYGMGDAFVALNGFTSDALSTDAEMAYLSQDRIFLVRATTLKCGDNEIIRFDKPVSVLWKTDESVIEADEDCHATFSDGAITLEKGVQARLIPLNDKAALLDAIGVLKGQIAKTAPIAQSKSESVAQADWRPSWETELPGGAVADIVVAPLNNPKQIWAAARESISIVSLDGEAEKSMELNAALCSLLPADGEAQAEAFSVLVGLRDDTIRAYSDSGEILWEDKAEVHHSFKRGDHYNAPWFCDPRPPRNKRGVFSIVAGDIWGNGAQEIALGRPVTLEFRQLDGTLIKRVPTQWGDHTTLAVLRKRGSSNKGHLLLAGKARCGTARVSAVDENYNVISNTLYADVPHGSTVMLAWRRRFIKHLEVADLDADGVEEIVVTRSGHWNELAVYNGTDDRCAWMASFGPDSPNANFMTGMAVADLTGDGKKEVVVGMRNGWVCAFDCAGNSIWRHQFPNAVTAVCKIDALSSVAVGGGDGFVYLMDGDGKITRTAKFDSSVTTLNCESGFLLVGTRAGKLARFAL